MASTLDLLKRLNDHRVRYVLVGGMACVIHGSQVVTQDVDLCAPLTQENLLRLLVALAGIHPRFRMTPELRLLPDDSAQLEGFKNLYLVTDLGQLDRAREMLRGLTPGEARRAKPGGHRNPVYRLFDRFEGPAH